MEGKVNKNTNIGKWNKTKDGEYGKRGGTEGQLDWEARTNRLFHKESLE